MKVRSISHPLPGERVVGVHPTMKPNVPTDWRRRLHLYNGRSLSAEAMDTEQAGRAGRMATLGQAVSPGVVVGLEIALESVVEPGGESPAAPHFVFQVAPGFGLTVYGEDIVVAKPLRVEVLDANVFAPVRILQADTSAPPPPPDETPLTGALEARALGAPLRQLIEPERGLPRAGILLLQPVTTEMVGELDPEDPCEQDPQNYAFEDWQRVDGCRLIFYAWPAEWLALPEFTEATRDTWRNRLAYEIFHAEAALGVDEVLPWEEIGLPIGLAGFNAEWKPLFVDRFSVVRAGGKPKRRTALVRDSGHPFLWQARLQQLAEQIAGADEANLPIADISKQFRFLPPIGLLPKNVVEPRAARQHFFPSTYRVEAVPVPLEQLDAAFKASAPLAPYDAFDTSTLELVRVLVPVPQVWYEPRLLQVEAVDEEFQETIERFVTRRGKWLLRREQVRQRASAIEQAVIGQPSSFPTPDPDALETETVATDPLDANDPKLVEPEDTFGTEVRGETTVALAFEGLKDDLRAKTPIKGETWARLEAPPSGSPSALPVLPAPFNTLLRHDTTRQALIFSDGVLSVAQRDALLAVAGGSPAFQVAVRELHTRSQDDELTQLDERGLEGFIAFIEEKVQRANDKIDFGFLRAQTDIYRVRQFMLGNVAAARLATSPALAAIAKGETALATKEDLTEFLRTIKGPIPSAPVPGAASPRAAEAAPVFTRASFARTTAAGSTAFAGGSISRISAGGDAGTIARQPVGGSSVGATVGSSAGTGILTSGAVVEAVFQPATPASVLVAGASVPSVNLFATPVAPRADDIIGRAAIVGKALDFRTVTVAERIEEPPAPEAKNFGVSNKFEVFQSLLETGLWMDDLELPGFIQFKADGTPDFADTKGRVFKETRRSIFQLRTTAVLSEVLADRHDPDPGDGDEAVFFGRAVRSVDHTVAALRLVEGRIQAYRAALEMCRKTLAALKDLLTKADARLTIIADELAEARHDVSVARALLAEETARVNGINQRRDQIIAEHVPFVAYGRPRLSDNLLPAPVRPLNPGLIESPIPACLVEAVPAPPELRALVDLFREAPLKWFTQLPALLDRLDRPDLLHGVFLTARQRAATKQLAVAPVQPVTGVSTRAVQTLQKVFFAQQQVVAQHRAMTAQFDLSALASQSWKVSREQADTIVSLGDLIDGGHGRVELARQAARELENIYRIAACLYAGFGQVLPSLRLDWTERLSQFDEPVNLRNLSSLPRWNEIEYLDRLDLQTLVDWLYQRVDVRQSEAVALVSDLVRSCLLLASHAPINQIISGHVPKATTVTPGGRVELTAVDFTRIRVGMNVLMYAGARVVAQAVVEDLSAGQVAARVVHAEGKSVALEQNARVQFAEPGGNLGRKIGAVSFR
jgi:hypothetical protein